MEILRAPGSSFWQVVLDESDWARYLEDPRVAPRIGRRVAGHISDRAAIRIWRPAGYAPRSYGAAARHGLEEARRILMERGDLRDRVAERRAADEARHGSFIVRLIVRLNVPGAVRRFNDSAKANRWAEEALKTSSATVAEFYRAPIEPPYPARVAGDLLYDIWSYVPFDSLYENEHGIVRRGTVAHRLYREVERQLHRDVQAVELPHEKEAAWLVLADAFEEAGIPWQHEQAMKRAHYWARLAHVSSRRKAAKSRPRSRRRQ